MTHDSWPNPVAQRKRSNTVSHAKKKSVICEDWSKFPHAKGKFSTPHKIYLWGDKELLRRTSYYQWQKLSLPEQASLHSLHLQSEIAKIQRTKLLPCHAQSISITLNFSSWRTQNSHESHKFKTQIQTKAQAHVSKFESSMYFHH